MPPIDTTSYDRTKTHPIRDGYQSRGGVTPSAIVIHTTNNRRRTTAFADEARYLRDAPNASAHYLVGKLGQIVQIVPPTYQAWHAGAALPAFANSCSIGIELHVSVGETPTALQLAATADLVLWLVSIYPIRMEHIETHRAVARPVGRKSDPEGWPDDAFSAWRAGLFVADADPFAGWGDVGRPAGDQRAWAIPRAWLQHRQLGRCLMSEYYLQAAAVEASVACFEHGVIVYDARADRAHVVMFD